MMRRGQIIVGSDESHMGDAEPSQKVFVCCPSSVVLCESLNSIRTYVRFVCECDHRLSHACQRLAEGSLPDFQAWNQLKAKRG